MLISSAAEGFNQRRIHRWDGRGRLTGDQRSQEIESREDGVKVVGRERGVLCDTVLGKVGVADATVCLGELLDEADEDTAGSKRGGEIICLRGSFRQVGVDPGEKSGRYTSGYLGLVVHELAERAREKTSMTHGFPNTAVRLSTTETDRSERGRRLGSESILALVQRSSTETRAGGDGRLGTELHQLLSVFGREGVRTRPSICTTTYERSAPKRAMEGDVHRSFCTLARLVGEGGRGRGVIACATASDMVSTLHDDTTAAVPRSHRQSCGNEDSLETGNSPE